VNGVITACLLPFQEDFSINLTLLRQHVKQVATVDGVNSICINEHASEFSSCKFEEQERILASTVNAIVGRTHLSSPFCIRLQRSGKP
jgi:dihydrodipicolinate synthase/N-acetylneuraminate lyase